ncbi:MAG: DUF1801 domain-containing protein [Candidatus Nanopelagicales bacterium]
MDAYIDALPQWQVAICRELRVLVHLADNEVVETIKRTDRPYFTLQGNVCALLAAKNHVNLFLYDGAIVPDPAKLITGGHDNTSARTIAFRQGDIVNADAVRDAPPDHREQSWRWLAQNQECASAHQVNWRGSRAEQRRCIHPYLLGRDAAYAAPICTHFAT